MKNKISKTLLVLAALTMIGGSVTACDNGGNQGGGDVETIKYSITFKNYDGTTIEAVELEAGSTPVCSKDPVRDDSNGFSYTFKGWATSINGKVLDKLPTVNGDAIYYAVYAAIPLKEEYTIKVLAPAGVTYSLNKNSAEEGEEIILTITGLSAGLAVKGVAFNAKEVQGESGVYKFTMPAKSVTIKISVSVSGDIVIEGDIAASFEKDTATGLYVAKNVEVPGNGETAKFNVVIKSGGSETALQALALDETKSFGTVVAGVSKEYVFSVATGATYDFYYDESDAEAPFYVQRSGVLKLPDNSLTLENLLITNKAVRSEYPMHPDDLVGISVSKQDITTDDVVYEDYNWKLYENNVSFATVEDKFDIGSDLKYVYKEYDEDISLYTVIDTYAKKNGNKTVNDDPFRLPYNKYGANAGRFSVIEEDDYGYRFSINEKKALRNVRTSAHLPNHLMEMDLYYCYRDSMEVDDNCVYYSLDISSVETGGGNFKTTVTSLREHGQTGSIYSSGKQDATTYKAVFTFNARGEVTSVNYEEKFYTVDQWQFNNHQAVIGQSGKKIKVIKGEYTYGNAYSGTPNFGDFNKEDYLVSSFNDVQFYNANAKDEESKAAGKSVVGIDNDIYFQTSEGDFSKYLVNENFYSPATALDIWQYGITASSDDSVIRKEANDQYYQYSAVDVGTSTVTFSSHIPGIGASTDVAIEVRSLAKARNFWMNNSDHSPNVDSDCLQTSERGLIKAGGTYRFKMEVTADNGIGVSESARLIYTAVSSNESLLTIRSAPNAKYLVVDVSSDAAKALTKKTSVSVTITSSEYCDWISPTVFTFEILPSDVDPIGTWKTTGTAADPKHFPETTLVFTNDAYTGPVQEGFEGAKVGYVKDKVIDGGTVRSTDYYRFYYIFKSGTVKAVLYEVSLEDADGQSTNPKDYTLEFNYDYENDYYGIFLATTDIESSSDYEETVYDVIIGFYDINVPENIDYAYFERVVG